LRTYLESDQAFKDLGGWSPDGRTLIFSRQAPTTRWDQYLLDVESGVARPYLAGIYNEQDGEISPDGRWVIYTSDETGRPEIFVQSYPTPGAKFQVTTTGGIRPAFLHDGKRITFGLASEPSAQKVADILPGPDFRIGPVRTLVRVPPDIQAADITPDGRFAVLVPAGKAPKGSITVILDWLGALRGR
jgi:Tol biopolymer transport system component